MRNVWVCLGSNGSVVLYDCLTDALGKMVAEYSCKVIYNKDDNTYKIEYEDNVTVTIMEKTVF